MRNVCRSYLPTHKYMFDGGQSYIHLLLVLKQTQKYTQTNQHMWKEVEMKNIHCILLIQYWAWTSQLHKSIVLVFCNYPKVQTKIILDSGSTHRQRFHEYVRTRKSWKSRCSRLSGMSFLFASNCYGCHSGVTTQFKAPFPFVSRITSTMPWCMTMQAPPSNICKLDVANFEKFANCKQQKE